MSLTIGATPVYAEQNGQLVGVFKDHPECERIGTHGVHHDWWNDYTCQWESRYRYYFLYV
ncbi:hypothetical protein AB0J42_31375 [Nonomuraea sp. NPDC049649]|uniref:hypothetical protein n=1 Tax=Nonomuraea sp. NPDC049649 TaxID=3155776 RepID=UPI00342C4994